MAINPNISLAVKGVELQDPLAQYGRVAAIQQAQQQNALANMQMQEYSRAREEEQGIRNRLAGGASLEDADTRNFLLGSKTGRDILQRQSDLQKSQTEEAARRAKLSQDTFSMYRDLSGEIKTKEDAARFLQRVVNDPSLKDSPIARIPLMEQVQRIPEDPQGLDDWVKRFSLGATKYITENKPVTFAQDTGAGGRLMTRPGLGGTATVVPGSEFTKQMAPGEAERLKNESRRIGLEGRRVAVLEENARRDADPVFQQRMGAARATGEAIAKGDVAAMQALPKVIGDAELAVGLLDQMVGKRDSKTGKLLTKDPVTGEPIKNNKPHPGFAPAVGMGGFGTLGIPGLAQLTPGTDAANFKTLYDQVMGAAFSEAFETLKGGGAITEKEGTKATAARNRMSLAQSEDEFVRAALEYRDIVAKGVERAQAKASRATTRMAPAAPAAGGVIDFGSLK
jgi:hypothetical protein